MRHRAALFAAVVVLATTVLPAAATAASTVSPAPAASAPLVRVRSFSCTGIMGRYYTRQTVNGTLTRLRPSNTTVLNYANTVMLTSPAPPLRNHWWGGYWKAAYQLNQWALGSASGSTYHLMLPDTAMGGTFTALLVTEFSVGGNWQNWMDCTAS
jgi:hypothetical protein